MNTRKISPARIVLRVLGLLLALILCLVLVLVLVPLTETENRSTVSGSADWMSRLPDDRPLNQIVLPGTHDSATKNVQLAFFSKCQSKDIGAQLEAGFRYLDIRLGVDAVNAKLKLMHGFTNCEMDGETLYLERVLNQCYDFLDEHPSETIVFAVKQEHGGESVAEFQSFLSAYVNAGRDYWLLTDRIPTLGEARGKLILMRRFEDEAGLGLEAGIPMLWINQNGHDDVSQNTVRSENGSYGLWVQDRYEYGKNDKWNAFLAGVQTAAAQAQDTDVCIHFLSTKGTAAYGHPYRFAHSLNARLMKSGEPLQGWVIVDFASAPLAARIYESNF